MVETRRYVSADSFAKARVTPIDVGEGEAVRGELVAAGWDVSREDGAMGQTPLCVDTA